MLRNEAAADAATDETFRRVTSAWSHQLRPTDVVLEVIDVDERRLIRREAQRRLELGSESMSENPSSAPSDAKTEAADAPDPDLASFTDADILRAIKRLPSVA